MTFMIVGMRKPEHCWGCPFRDPIYGNHGTNVCLAHNKDTIETSLDEPYMLKPKWCPVMDVTDLTEMLGTVADELYESEEGKELSFMDGFCWTMNEITLLKPEKSDGK